MKKAFIKLQKVYKKNKSSNLFLINYLTSNYEFHKNNQTIGYIAWSGLAQQTSSCRQDITINSLQLNQLSRSENLTTN